MKKTFTTPVTGPLSLTINATTLELAVKTVPGLTEATFELEGPSEVIEGATARASHDGDLWAITLPAPEPTVIGGQGVTVIGGNIRGVSMVSSGDIFVGGGTTVINGQVITGAVTEPVKARVLLPVGASLSLPRLRNGHVLATGEYGRVDFRSTNASLDIEHATEVEADTSNGSITVGTATELIDVSTTNGSITTRGSAPRTRARATNGSIVVLVSGPHWISARTTNGDVTVIRNGHQAEISTSTTNGSDRVV